MALRLASTPLRVCWSESSSGRRSRPLAGQPPRSHRRGWCFAARSAFLVGAQRFRSARTGVVRGTGTAGSARASLGLQKSAGKVSRLLSCSGCGWSDSAITSPEPTGFQAATVTLDTNSRMHRGLVRTERTPCWRKVSRIVAPPAVCATDGKAVLVSGRRILTVSTLASDRGARGSALRDTERDQYSRKGRRRVG